MRLALRLERRVWVPGLWLLAIAIFYFLRHPARLGLDADISLPAAQLIVLPLVVGALWHLSVLGQGIPRKLILGAGAIAVGAAAYYSIASWTKSGEIIAARFRGDKRESLTLGFLERLSARRGPFSDFDFARHNGSFSSHADVVERFANHPQIRAVVWGNINWLNISKPLSAVGLEAVSSPLISGDELLMVVSVPIIGVRYDPINETVQYISEILTAESMPDLSSGQEAAFGAAGSINAPWTLLMNRAYAWWREGNIHLRRALNSDSPELGELACAGRAYAIAKNMLAFENHPELFNAISNNQALVDYFRGRVAGEPLLVKRAIWEFRSAAKSRRGGEYYGLMPRAGLAARANYRFLDLKYGGRHDPVRRNK